MSKDATTTTPSAPTTPSAVRTARGVVPGVVHLALDVADRGQSTTIALLQDGRTELASIVIGTVDHAEKATMSVFRLIKKAIARFDEGTSETLAGVEKIVTTTVKTARDTTTTALNGLVGQNSAAA